MNLLHRIKRNQIEMMMIRGYKIDEQETNIFNMDADDFLYYYKGLESDPNLKGHPLNKLYKSLRQGIPDVMIFYVKADDDNNIKAENLKKYFKNLVHEVPSSTNIILIGLNTFRTAKQLIQDYTAYKIDIFTVNELLINPTKHPYSEKIIRKLTDEEKLKETIPADKEPQLAYDDPVVKFWGLLPGDIVICDRRNLDEKNLITSYPVKKVISTNSIYILETNV